MAHAKSVELPLPARARTRLGVHAAALVPGIAAIGVLLWWAAAGGGYDPGVWYPGTIGLAALLAVSVGALGAQRARLSREATLALGALAAYVAWSYLSILWAGSPGDALEGSNRALAYLLIASLFAVLPWTARGARAALGVFALGVGVIGLVTLLRLAAGDVGGMFINARLASPAGYQNANAALFTIAALPALALAAQRERQIALRAALLASATICLELAVLCQSRGWLFTLPVVGVTALAVAPGRARTASFALLPIAATAAALPALLDVFRHAGYHGVNRPAAEIHRLTVNAAGHAAKVALAAAAVVALAGVAAAIVDRRRVPSVAGIVRGRRAGRAAAALGVLVALTAGVALSHGRPLHAVSHAWSSFKSDNVTTSSTRFAELGGSRYDFWRVAVDSIAAHPLAGIGQDGFAQPYLRARRSAEEPRWTHSIELRVLVGTGIAGAAAFLAFLVFALRAALRRRSDPAARAAAGIALLPLVVWLAHGSVDWLWEFPALSGAVFAFLGMALALGSRGPAGVPPREPSLRARPSVRRAAAAAVVALVALALVPAYVANRETAAALAAGLGAPKRALAELGRAASLTPFDARPRLIGGALALETGRVATARVLFADAIAREPDGWFGHYGAALAASATGRHAAALRELRTARRLDPSEPLVGAGLQRVTRGGSIDAKRALTVLATRAQRPAPVP